MSPTLMPTAEQLRAHPELGALAALAVALALARQALRVGSPDDADPLCPRRDSAGVVLEHLASLEGALARYRKVLANEDALRLF